jgi:hypothetical protein
MDRKSAWVCFFAKFLDLPKMSALHSRPPLPNARKVMIRSGRKGGEALAIMSSILNLRRVLVE